MYELLSSLLECKFSQNRGLCPICLCSLKVQRSRKPWCLSCLHCERTGVPAFFSSVSADLKNSGYRLLRLSGLAFFSLYLVVCFDAKINFDDNAEFRQKDIFAMDDKSENEPIENEAARYDLKYIGLDGNIACFGKYRTQVWSFIGFLKYYLLIAVKISVSYIATWKQHVLSKIHFD